MESNHSKNKPVDYLNQGILAVFPTIEEKIACLKDFPGELDQDAFLFFIQHEHRALSSAIIGNYNNEIPRELIQQFFKTEDTPNIMGLVERGEAFTEEQRDLIFNKFINKEYNNHTFTLFLQNRQTPFTREQVLTVLNRKNESECCSLVQNTSIPLEQCDFESLWLHFCPERSKRNGVGVFSIPASSRVTSAILYRKDFTLKDHHVNRIEYTDRMSIQKALVWRDDYIPPIQKIESILTKQVLLDKDGQILFNPQALMKDHPNGDSLFKTYEEKKPLWEKHYLQKAAGQPLRNITPTICAL